MEDDVDMKKIAVITGASSGLGRESHYRSPDITRLSRRYGS